MVLVARDGDSVRDFIAAVAVVIVLMFVFSFCNAPNETQSGSGTQQTGDAGSTQLGEVNSAVTMPAVTQSAQQYICIKSFQISVYDADGNYLQRKATVRAGDIYEASWDLLISPKPAIHLDMVGNDIWIEISPATLEKYFEKLE